MSETDRRLKDHLNTNQTKRERMCLEILSVQTGYSDLRPRLPKGGPDGGRDIQGFYEGRLCFGGVGFVNDASDTKQHREQIKSKFKDDLKNACKASSGEASLPSAFVFFTNVGLTPSIIDSLRKIAYSCGIEYCDIFDRERIRIILDSNRGYAIRLRYLDITLSDAEQKDFFSAWADQINSAIGSGFKSVDQATKRIQFLLEAQLPINHLSTIVKFKTSVWDACKGEFFFQTGLSLRVHSEGLLGIIYGGCSDKIVEAPEEWRTRENDITRNSQHGFAFSWLIPQTVQYDRLVLDKDKAEIPINSKRSHAAEHIRTIRSHGILEADRKFLHFEALSEPFLERFEPTCKLLELDGCMIIFDCSKELCDNIEEIKIMGGGYELLTITEHEFRSEKGDYDRLKIPKEAKQKAGDHEWVTLRPAALSSCFTIDLIDRTPRRYDWP